MKALGHMDLYPGLVCETQTNQVTKYIVKKYWLLMTCQKQPKPTSTVTYTTEYMEMTGWWCLKVIKRFKRLYIDEVDIKKM